MWQESGSLELGLSVRGASKWRGLPEPCEAFWEPQPIPEPRLGCWLWPLVMTSLVSPSSFYAWERTADAPWPITACYILKEFIDIIVCYTYYYTLHIIIIYYVRYYMDIDMDKLANSLLDEVKYLRPYLEVLLRSHKTKRVSSQFCIYLI